MALVPTVVSRRALKAGEEEEEEEASSLSTRGKHNNSDTVLLTVPFLFFIPTEKSGPGLGCSSQLAVVTSHPNKKQFVGDYCRMVQTKWIFSL